MNSLLPKKGEFSNKGYWNKFFNARKAPFEWYGDFVQLSGYFGKYVRASDNVLVIGCGNSELGAMLVEKLNCCSVVNIDISEDVIQQMRHKYQAFSSKVLSFECANVLELKDHVSSGAMQPFKCIVDKGTLDAIYSEDDSDSVVKKMFDNISSSLTLMGRYMVVTLAQEHIVNALCHYFITSHSEWMINCHQLTSNSVQAGDQQSFCLPVFGFVFTKLRPTADVPRISVFPFNSDTPTRLNSQGRDTDFESLRQSLKNWITGQQSWSLLRHDFSAGEEMEFRFTCTVSQMTVFYCRLVRLPGNRMSRPNRRDKNVNRSSADAVENKIDGVFLIPYGQNYCTDYSNEEGRRALCRSLKLASLLFVFVNPRVFISDLDSLKHRLSEALGNIQSTHTEGAPIMSTPGSYVHRELSNSTESTDLPTTLTADEIELAAYSNATDQADVIRRLVCASADMRPIIMTVPAKHELPPSVLCPRDLHLRILLSCLSESMEPCSPGVGTNFLYLGLPPLLPVSQSSVHIFPVGVDPVLRRAIKSQMQRLLCDVESPAVSIPTFITELDDIAKPYSTVIYDPWALRQTDYCNQFLTDAIATLLYLFDKCVPLGGWLLIFTEECCVPQQPDILRQITANGSLSHLVSYSIPDSLFADPVTHVHLFAKTNKSRDQIASYLADRLDGYVNNQCTSSRTEDQVLQRDACCKLKDALCK